MKKYLHRVLGLYKTRSAADSGRQRLLDQGLPLSQLVMLQPGFGALSREVCADSDDVLYEVLHVGVLGALVGMVVGAIATSVLMAVGIGLFDSNAMAGAVIMVSNGMAVGGLVGAIAGARNRRGHIADLLKGALAQGQFVLVAHTTTEQQTEQVREILGTSLAGAAQQRPDAAPPGPATARRGNVRASARSGGAS